MSSLFGVGYYTSNGGQRVDYIEFYWLDDSVPVTEESVLLIAIPYFERSL